MAEGLSPELLDVLRLSLKSSADILLALEERPRVPSSDHIRELIKAILWHRKFVLTYYALIALIVALCGGYGLYKRWARLGQQRERECVAALTTSSSSSSTLEGSATPPQKNDPAETTPLLCSPEPSTREGPALLDRVRSVLMHQPRPIRALTSPRNVLPNNGTTLTVLFFFALNLFYLFYRVPLSETGVFILADRAGLLFVVNLPILYLLAAKTNQPIKAITGWSYEGLNLFHRRLGEWMIAFAVLHMLGMFATWYAILRPLGFTLLRYLTARVVLLGISAILSYLIIYITSIGWFRHLYYEAFLGFHIFFQVAALVFLFFHYPTARPYVLATFAIWAIDRLLWRISLSSRRVIASLEVAPDEHTILLHCEIDLRKTTFGIRSHLHHGWLPGQHVFLTIPSMGFKYRFQAHPFTIASPAPPRDSTTTSWPLLLVIRSIDGFSHDLLKFARHHQHCEVTLDGPHGGIEALEAARGADRVCFVAGGSGIAVTYPLAWDVRVKQDLQAEALVSSRTVYAGGQRIIPAVRECGPLTEPSAYGHFWVRQDPRHDQWISMFPRAHTVKAGYPGDVYVEAPSKDDGHQEVASIVTHTFDTRRPGLDGGRPDMSTELWHWVTSVPASRSSSSNTLTLGAQPPGSDRTHHGSSMSKSKSDDNSDISRRSRSRDEKLCIIVSGPDGLVRDVRNIAAQLVHQGWNLEVWVEKFGW
ncbi:hypothetical protein A1O1_04735 [Capronia coronata CBS 617.96]|uniref:FAD-binding FR-type domain-containing protein n=1 Tax=Capronia coronata CBS 617.96 TaxID=1182541 RepID=W9Y5K2_9EURO|nr:uncharacterized protein A1O1_04735 [Capronia coronata CBS 617.96]EXJ87808.1 hypothetical protein A1O1_04735 [Capronia coronata CBS 617.96]